PRTWLQEPLLIPRLAIWKAPLSHIGRPVHLNLQGARIIFCLLVGDGALNYLTIVGHLGIVRTAVHHKKSLLPMSPWSIRSCSKCIPWALPVFSSCIRWNNCVG